MQFVFLAFQNSMAANIDGYMIHHWSGMSVGDHGAVGSIKDGNKLSIKCQNLRFIFIDEISMVSAELLGSLNAAVKKVTRVRSTYKRRNDGTERSVGGANVCMLGGFW